MNNISAPPTPSPGPRIEFDYLTAEQVAELLQVASPTVYGWAKRDPSMPMLKIGGTVRFPRTRLLEWLRSREQGRPPMRRRLHSVANPAPEREADHA